MSSSDASIDVAQSSTSLGHAIAGRDIVSLFLETNFDAADAQRAIGK
jgi:hypothetical protein